MASRTGAGVVSLPAIPASASGPWPAPAKLNLFLHITGRRVDGYHELQTLFQFLTWADWLYFDIHPDAVVIRRGSGPAAVDEENDLCVRAARLLQQETGCRHGVTLYNDKRLPLGGGLGGGSSDAATTLLVLNREWQLGLSINELSRLALRLGADVPVFVRGHSAVAEGVGEQFTAAEPAQAWYVVIDPAVNISTASVFSAVELTRDTPRQTIPDLLSGATRNDCEAVVRHGFPEVAAALDWLNAYSPARMTGTGGCVFAAFASPAEASRVAALVPQPWTGQVARGVNRSPLLVALE
jgi:4-diphosphocytidyl-2-C-methyl-D-erythritol kinase